MIRTAPAFAAALLALATLPARPGAAPAGAPPATSGPAASGPAPVVPQPVRYAAPVAPLDVVRRFDPPATPYGAGHRGVDLAVRAGQPVRSAADGVVAFAATLAGRGVVVVQHRDGIRTEYEPVTPTVTAGAPVRVGAVLATVHGRHGGCVPDRCLHWGARRGVDYLDPMSLLGRLGPVRLLPWTGDGPG